jgi:hypothetical protein
MQDADSTTPALGEIAPPELEEDSLTPDIMSQVIAAKKRSSDELSTESTTKPKPQKEIKKKITRRNHVNTYQPPEVEITLPDEKVVDWKDEEHANGHVLSLKEVAVVSDQDLLDASMIGINGKTEKEFVTEDYVEPEEYEEPKDYISPEFEPVMEQEDIDGVEWMGTPDSDTDDEIVVFEFEEDGETKSQELEVTLEETAATSDEKPKSKPKTSGKHKKERLIPIPGIGFVTRTELQRALGMTDEDGLEDFNYEDIPIPYGVPLKMDDSIDSNSNLHCKWCDKPIKGKYIKVRREELDGTKLAIVGPFCSPECAAKFGK